MTVKKQTEQPNAPAKRNGKRRNGHGSTPLINLPPRIPRQLYRPAQPNIPDDKAVRNSLRSTAERHIQQAKIIPPLTLDELRTHTAHVLKLAGVDEIYRDFAAVIVSNEAWRDTLARIPYDRRLLLLPKCLRADGRCPAPIDEFGLLCKGCGLCAIKELTQQAERLGYAVLVAEGSAVVTKMIETGKIEAVVGVSCLNVLEKCFPHMEARAVPGAAIPLLQDGCANTTVDLDWVWDVIHLTSEDRTYRLNLDAVRKDVQSWFTSESLSSIIGPPDGETARIAYEWLAGAGKRWRPYLAVCVFLALQSEECRDEPPAAQRDLKKLAIAVECFHKASLIHDDIEDGDEIRYGKKAMHVEHSMPVALNVGDFLLGEGYRLIGELDLGAQRKVDMLRLAADGHLTLSKGQGAELCWARAPEPLSSLEVLDIFRQKTAPAFEVALRLGAFFAGANREVHEVLSRYSESLGVAYQIRDDLEDFTGNSDSHDLRDLRPSLVLAVARKKTANRIEADLITSLWNHNCDYDVIADEVQRVIRERGVVDKTYELQEAYTEQATRSLRSLKNPTLKGLLRRVVGKIFGEDTIQGYCSEFEARNAAGGKESAEPAA
ncbi:MAG: polyprenyl synthetase family protein [Phycisphaerales bacterium]|nr:MAG: polyprenyl synthetase family protein [Phycisphaerales bacterium]